jgi:endonuclease YncB( thermonuclease family)
MTDSEDRGPPSRTNFDENTSIPGVEIGPLSIQAAALVRSIESLSALFWITIGGAILTVLLAGLNQLESNVASDSLFIGEYQIPKAILPVASLAFATFLFWMTANRMRMLDHVLDSSRLPEEVVHQIFHLNPPVLNVFHPENRNRFSLTSGIAVLVITWCVFFGNTIAFMLASAIQQGAAVADFDFPLLTFFGIATFAIILLGVRSVSRPLHEIMVRLHGTDFRFGWVRSIAALAITVTVISVNNMEQFSNPSEQEDDLLGPAFANAIDGDTLFIRGTLVDLFGIDAVESDQTCFSNSGAEYPCGHAATLHLQQRIANTRVICVPFFNISKGHLVASCDLVIEGVPLPRSPEELLDRERTHQLSAAQVRAGHAIALGFGRQFLEADQNAAQEARLGIWQGAFEPPWVYRKGED